MKYFQRPILSPVDSGYELLEDCVFPLNNGIVYTVPKGYVTNGADIPRFLWSLFPPNKSQYMAAVIIHDWLCDVAGLNNDDQDTYAAADDAFKEVLIDCGINKVTVSIFYNAVKIYHKLKYK